MIKEIWSCRLTWFYGRKGCYQEHLSIITNSFITMIELKWPTGDREAKRSNPVVTLTTFSGKRIATVWRPSVCVCPVEILAVTNQGAACDAAIVRFRPSITRTDRLSSLCKCTYLLTYLLVSTCRIRWRLTLRRSLRSCHRLLNSWWGCWTTCLSLMT